MDGIDDYRGAELEWAVGTVLCEVSGHPWVNQPDAKRLLSSDWNHVLEGLTSAWDLIAQSFADEALTPPDTEVLLAAIRKELVERAKSSE